LKNSKDKQELLFLLIRIDQVLDGNQGIKDKMQVHLSPEHSLFQLPVHIADHILLLGYQLVLLAEQGI
tara:strand:+ start:6481 stop:6684 length:204 start_codon:yes stop_codon:yes gene_type:complete